MTITLHAVKRSEKKDKKWTAVFYKDGKPWRRQSFGYKNPKDTKNDFTLHKDKKRRLRYVTRHMSDLNSNDPTRAGYLSMFLLWGETPNLEKQKKWYRNQLKKYNKTGNTLEFKRAAAKILKKGVVAEELLHGGKRNVKARRKVNKVIVGNRKVSMPKKYYAGLSKKDKEAQIRGIVRARKAYKKGKYISRPKVSSYKKKKSGHVERAKKKFGVSSMRDLKTLHKKTNCSIASMKKIIQKGKGAYYSGGSRPGQTADSWAYARLASALTGGPAARVDKKQLREGKCKASIQRAANKRRQKK